MIWVELAACFLVGLGTTTLVLRSLSRSIDRAVRWDKQP